MEKWSRRIRDVLGSVLAALVLVGILVSIDERARESFGRVVSDVSQARVAAALAPVTSVITDVSASPQFGNMFLVALVGAAGVLTLLMLRT